MASQVLRELEKQIGTLSHSDKLWLLERLAIELRQDSFHDLTSMANDPDIQAEISQINKEFQTIEDGLEGL